MEPVDVLVAGAGPVGLTVAHELVRRGLRVRLVDAADGPAVTSRALATHPRTLETYDQMGVLPEILERGREVQAFTLHARGRQLVRLGADYSRLPTRFPFTLMVDQAITEEVLRGAVARHGVRVEWGVRLEGFEQDADGVTTVLRDAGGEHRQRSAYLVGCDGGHSTVRRLLGLTLIGDSTETWLIADAQVRTDLPQDSIHWLHVGLGTVMAVPFPEPGRWRLLDTAEVAHADDPAHVAERFAAKLTAGSGLRAEVGTPSWVSVFTIQQRMVPAMRVDRVAVAGDAAHVHSPASGQGVNTGIQDGYNLGWKLAMVAAGQAAPALLDTYSAERVPVGRSLLSSTRAATGFVQLRGALTAAALPVGGAVLRTVGPVRGRLERKIMGAMSALGLEYAPSPLSIVDPTGDHRPGPGQRLAQVTAADADRPGWRELLAELRDPRWTLLLVRPPAPDPFADQGDSLSGRTVGGDRPDADGAGSGDWLSVRTVGGDLPDPDGALVAALDAGPGDWLLVRPDGYLAARGTAGDRSGLAAACAAAGVTRPYPATR